MWTAAAPLAGGKAVHYICDEASGWMPDLDDMKGKVTARTKAVVIINPNNPTGALYGKDILERIVKFARENELIIFSDEVYDRLVMDGEEHISIASLCDDLFVITLNGLSKSHLIAGFRSAWMCLSGDKTRARSYIEGLNILSSMRLCSNVPAQQAIAAALGSGCTTDALLLPGGRIYEQRETACSLLEEIDGISVVRPKAGFYVFRKLKPGAGALPTTSALCWTFSKARRFCWFTAAAFTGKSPTTSASCIYPPPRCFASN